MTTTALEFIAQDSNGNITSCIIRRVIISDFNWDTLRHESNLLLWSHADPAIFMGYHYVFLISGLGEDKRVAVHDKVDMKILLEILEEGSDLKIQVIIKNDLMQFIVSVIIAVIALIMLSCFIALIGIYDHREGQYNHHDSIMIMYMVTVLPFFFMFINDIGITKIESFLKSGPPDPTPIATLCAIHKAKMICNTK